MRSKTIKRIIVSVLIIFLLTAILTAIVAVREASRPLSSDPIMPDQTTTANQQLTGNTDQPTTGQGE